MAIVRLPSALAPLRARIEALERHGRPDRAVLPFGIEAVDARLPGGGLACGGLHEVAGGGAGAIDAAAAAAFAAGIAARTQGGVVWCVTRADLFPPGIAQAGLPPDRVVHVTAGDEQAVLATLEEALRTPGIGAAVGEIARLSMTASRRLQLAAEETGALGLALRRARRADDVQGFGQPTAAMTRWRISALPSAPLPVPGVGRARWLVELLRVRGGAPAEFVLEGCDATGRLAVPADLADRPGAARRSGA